MSIGKKTFRGASWNAIAMVANQVINLGRMAIMARLLRPEEFGLYAMIQVFVVFFQMFGDMGSSFALVQKQEHSRTLPSSVFFLNLGFAFIMSLVFFMAAPFVAAVYHEPRLVPMLQCAAAIFFIASIGFVHESLMRKEFKFKELALATVYPNFIGSVISIPLAYWGFGVYSLIYQALITTLIMVILYWVYEPWRPLMKFSVADIRSIFKFTSNLTSFNILNYFARNADNFLIGKYIGGSALGFYDVSYKMMLFPLQRVSVTLTNVLFSSLSQMQNDTTRLRAAYLKSIHFLAMVTFPIMLFGMALADDLILTVYGPAWKPVIELFIILAPVGMIQSIVTTVGTVYMSKGRTDLMLKIGGINAVATTLSFIIGIRYGVKGVAISYAVVNALMLYPNLKIAFQVINLSVRETVLKLAPVFAVTAGIAIVIWIIKVYVVNPLEFPVVFKLLLLTALAAAAYLLAMWHWFKDDLAILRRYF